MNVDMITDLGQQALVLTTRLSAPLMITILIVGLAVAIFQATTQINEMTLSFVPKLIAVAAVLMYTGPWMATLMVDYTRELFRNIPSLIG